MACPECGETFALRKGMVRGPEDSIEKSDDRECPNCGADVDRSDKTRLEKNI